MDLSRIVTSVPSKIAEGVTFKGKLLVSLKGDVCGGNAIVANVNAGEPVAYFNVTYAPKQIDSYLLTVPVGGSTLRSATYGINEGCLTIYDDIAEESLVFFGIGDNYA